MHKGHESNREESDLDERVRATLKANISKLTAIKLYHLFYRAVVDYSLEKHSAPLSTREKFLSKAKLIGTVGILADAKTSTAWNRIKKLTTFDPDKIQKSEFTFAHGSGWTDHPDTHINKQLRDNLKLVDSNAKEFLNNFLLDEESGEDLLSLKYAVIHHLMQPTLAEARSDGEAKAIIAIAKQVLTQIIQEEKSLQAQLPSRSYGRG